MIQKQWVFLPDSGGTKVPASKKREVTQRIEKLAADNYAGKYTRLGIRFCGQFCYIDAYVEPVVADGWSLEDWSETREEMIERRLRNNPVHLCRLRYFGGDKMGDGLFRLQQ